ncbi:MAG: hypothetical protein ABIQ08_06550, partial [Duganella sp.]
RGTDAPVLGPILDLPVTVKVGQDLALTLNFIDNSWTQTHKASVDWGDGCASPAPTLAEFGGSGQVRLRHRFCAPGCYSIKVLVTDSGGRATELQRDVFVEEPRLAALSGEGTLRGGAPVVSFRPTWFRWPLNLAAFGPDPGVGGFLIYNGELSYSNRHWLT